MVVSKTKHSKTKTEARSTQNSKTKHPKTRHWSVLYRHETNVNTAEIKRDNKYSITNQMQFKSTQVVNAFPPLRGRPGGRLCFGRDQKTENAQTCASFSRFWGLRFRSRVPRFRDRVLRFRVLGASFSRFRSLRFRDFGVFVFDLGCFVFEFWVLRASVFVFECFVFETTQNCYLFLIRYSSEENSMRRTKRHLSSPVQ